MPWWRKPPASSAPTLAPRSPTQVELVPGQLTVHIYQHDLSTQLGPLSCWTYLTDGLQRLHQPEVSLTLLRQPNSSAPEEPIHFFSMLHQLAQRGQIVQAGDWTQFGARKFFERHLAYIPAQPMESVPLLSSAIMAISVTDDELAAVQEFGILRVMARLGQQARYYPCPPWLDPLRPGISFDQTRQHSLLARLASIRIPHIRVVQIQDQLVVRLDPVIRPQLIQHLAHLPETQPIAFLAVLLRGYQNRKVMAAS